jgi:hypothetical protein
VVRSNHNKTKKSPEKIIPWRQNHLRPDVAVRKEKSPCHYADEVVDVVVVAFIFNRAIIEKTISPCLLAIAEEEEINLQYQEIWHEKTITLRT